MKKNFLSLTLLAMCFLIGSSFAQTASTGSVTRFYENAKVGYKNKATGEVVVPPNYVAGSEMMTDENGNHYALVLEGRKRGFINEKGTVIIPFIYDDASVFFNGLARVMKESKHGYINIKGETVIPFQYEFAADFKNGLARVQKDGKWGFINPAGQVAIPMEYKNAFDFSEGMAPVMNAENKWGFIDASGKFVLTPKYLQAQSFSNGEALVKNGDEFIYINKSGKKLRELKHEEGEYEQGKKSQKKD